MSSFLRAVVLLVVVCDPLGALRVAGVLTDGADRTELRRFAVAAGGAVFAALALAVLASQKVLDLLELSPGSVTLAGAVVLVVPGVWLLARGDRGVLASGMGAKGIRAALVPVAFPVLAGPGALLVTISLAVTRGPGVTTAAAAVVAAVAGALIATGSSSPVRRYPVLLNRVGGRVVGAAVLVVALALAVEGVLGY